MIYIEHEGTVFRAPKRGGPFEAWSAHAWTLQRAPKGKLGCGREISEDEALRRIEEAGEPPRTVGEDIEIDPWKYDDYDGGREEPKPGALAHLDLRTRKKALSGLDFETI